MIYHQTITSKAAHKSERKIVFIHGLAENHSIFGWQFKALRKAGYSSLVYDLAGHGLSPVPAKKITIRKHAEDLERILDRQNITEAGIVGFSLGGAVALEYAYRYPERVTKMCLINPALYSKKYLTMPARMLLPFLPFLKLVSGIEQKIKPDGVDLSKAKLSTAYFSFPNGLRVTSFQGLYVNVLAFVEYGIPDFLSEISTETLVIRSENDELLKEGAALHLEETMPNCRVKHIKGNHVVMLNNTKGVNEILLDYFGEQKK